MHDPLYIYHQTVEEAAKLRQAAKQASQREEDLPMCNADWQKWMRKHHKLFRETMLHATKARQESLSKRLEAFSDLVAVPRLRPRVPAAPLWAQKVKAASSGPFFLVKWTNCKQVFCGAGVGPDCWGFPLESTQRNTVYLLRTDQCFSSCVPLQNFLIHGKADSAVEPLVYSLEVQISKLRESILEVEVLNAMEVTHVRAAREASEDAAEWNGEDGFDSDIESVDSVGSNMETEDEGDAGLSEDTMFKAEDGGAVDSDKPDSASATALPAGTHTVWTNSYFTLSNYKGKPDCKIIMKTRWATDDELGPKDRSKTLQIKDFDGDSCADPPEQTYLALRAWMLHRVQQGNWHSRNKERHRWFQRELADLKCDIQKYPLSTATAKALREWTPQVV